MSRSPDFARNSAASSRNSPCRHAVAGAHINVAGQQANTLLHDGHAWKDFARTMRAGTRRAMHAAQADGATLMVHASFAFVHAVEEGARLDEPLHASVETILECEAMAHVGAGAGLRRAAGLSVWAGEH